MKTGTYIWVGVILSLSLTVIFAPSWNDSSFNLGKGKNIPTSDKDRLEVPPAEAATNVKLDPATEQVQPTRTQSTQNKSTQSQSTDLKNDNKRRSIGNSLIEAKRTHGRVWNSDI
ncbi:hypothetical protein H1S01_07565 [Heliobacterium chlorum]|uniref:Secreted protein n=1 Tax=Heliobacterium chlorum TaxID=2698 RepID=A0ABR7T0P5_HELCL|nr:hypothetical protein [Heliobacterium chlorum]MBC9784368.1 hypothetical protein [Heliobacterium chlorum]